MTSLKKKMLRIILGILVIFLTWGILGFSKDKATDEPAKPIGDLLHRNIMENLNGNYKDNIDVDIANLKVPPYLWGRHLKMPPFFYHTFEEPIETFFEKKIIWFEFKFYL